MHYALDTIRTYEICQLHAHVQRFDLTHALTCKKGGFIHTRNDNIKNILTGRMSKVCKDVEKDP